MVANTPRSINDNSSADSPSQEHHLQSDKLPRYDSISKSPTPANENGDNNDSLEEDDEWELLNPPEDNSLSTWDIIAILSMAFSYGCIMTTLFLITLPLECDRIEQQHPGIPKSIALGIFVAISGVTNLISPLIGMLSDTYRPPRQFELGQRMPYFVLGGMCSTFGLLGQYIESYNKLWLRYGFFYFLTMIGMNICYSMMIVLIPDQVPKHQTGTANGILAFLIVTGSFFGFGLFHLVLDIRIQDMYGLYVCLVISTTILTAIHAHDRDALLNAKRGAIIVRREGERRSARRMLLGPWLLLKTMLYDPVTRLDSKSLSATYSIDIKENYDFFVVTVSRLCYYCGVSIQTFFLYFLHDIINVKDDPEAAVAFLAVMGQVSAAFICYPVGFASDRWFGGKRKPFVFLACGLLGATVFSMIWAKTMQDMILLSCIFGASNGIYLTMETSLAVDSLPHHYEEGPSGGNAQLLGIWGVAAFLGSALGPMIGGPMLYLFGKNADSEEQTYSLQGYAVIMTLASCYFLMSALCLRWIH